MFVKVKVFANSKKVGVVRKSTDSFEVRVKERARNGEANKASIDALADYLKISPQKVRIIKGFKQKNKIFDIR